jgi:hypothetical protein
MNFEKQYHEYMINMMTTNINLNVGERKEEEEEEDKNDCKMEAVDYEEYVKKTAVDISLFLQSYSDFKPFHIIDTLYSGIDLTFVPELFKRIYVLDNIESLYKSIEVNKNSLQNIPNHLVQRAVSKLANKVILLFEDEGVFVFHPDGTSQCYFSIYSNELCGIIEQCLPDMYKQVGNVYEKFSIQDYVEMRRCTICKDDENHKTHVILPCSHTVCKRCVLHVDKKCIVCRSIVKSVQLIDAEDTISMNLKGHNNIKRNRPNKFF